MHRSGMLLPFLFRALLLLAITAMYAAFDIFNKRNVPDLFVYAALIIGIAVTLTYSMHVIEISLALAAVICAVGYIPYRRGMLGAGDFLEFATISLLLPIQPAPILSNLQQFGFPFILSVFIVTGYAAVVGTLAYYLLGACVKGRLKAKDLERRRIYLGIGIFVAYMVMLALLSRVVYVSIAGILLVVVIALASSITILAERQINRQMVTYLYPDRLTVEDMIATNLMSESEIRYFTSRSKHFGRLVTKRLIGEIKGYRKKLPVYTSGVPLALFAFIAVIVSLLLGNILLYIIL